MSTEQQWVRTYQDGYDFIESIGGVGWSDAGLPRRWHRCRPQTRGSVRHRYTERCACGGMRLAPNGPWLNHNETRRGRKRERRNATTRKVTVKCGSCGQPYEAPARSIMAKNKKCDRCWSKDLTPEET
jgi:hypothetical protein